MSKFKNFTHKWIGNRAFYKSVLYIAIPLIIQQVVTSFVNMLDNIMVGQTGTLPMSAVSISNQLISVFTLAMFGTISAASIFGAQFYGKNDHDGVRNCLRFKLVASTAIVILFTFIFLCFGNKLVSLFLNPGTNTPENIQTTLHYAMSYIWIMLIGFLPFGLSQSISSSMREAGETRLPMTASIIAVAVNFVGNSILIFGLFGLPAMGAAGAATATVISRFAELAVILIGAKRSKERFPFFEHVITGFHVPAYLVKNIILKGMPLIANEILWSIGMAAIAQCYSVRGIDAVASYNITTTIENVFFVFNLAIGDCISIMVSQRLGASDLDGAVETDRRLIVFAVLVSLGLGVILFLTAPIFPQFYNTTDVIRAHSAGMLRIYGLTLWISAIYNASYFTLRSGGKTVITFLFDSVGTMAVSFPVAFILAHFTGFNIITMYLILHLLDLYKVILGLFLVHKRIWVNDLVSSH